MKARWPMRCACGCRRTIEVGSQFVMHAGNPWVPRHLSAYKAHRRRKVAASL